MHLNPESLSFALLISDLGSIARAANILGMKQATLSRKLTALESRVGVRLFDRSTRGAVPTVSGGRVSESSAPDRGGSGHTPHLESRSGKW
jgi:DNA-binding transcriptional LysR family regulator